MGFSALRSIHSKIVHGSDLHNRVLFEVRS
jgi:hypothetical protein